MRLHDLALYAVQLLQERGETATKHGRATFAVLLLQDLAVVVLLMLVPLLAKGGSGVHFYTPAAGSTVMPP